MLTVLYGLLVVVAITMIIGQSVCFGLWLYYDFFNAFEDDDESGPSGSV